MRDQLLSGPAQRRDDGCNGFDVLGKVDPANACERRETLVRGHRGDLDHPPGRANDRPAMRVRDQPRRMRDQRIGLVAVAAGPKQLAGGGHDLSGGREPEQRQQRFGRRGPRLERGHPPAPARSVVPASVSTMPATWTRAGRSRKSRTLRTTLIVANCAPQTEATLTGPRSTAATKAPNATASTAPTAASRNRSGLASDTAGRRSMIGTRTTSAENLPIVTAVNGSIGSVSPYITNIRPKTPPARIAHPAPAARRSPRWAHESDVPRTARRIPATTVTPTRSPPAIAKSAAMPPSSPTSGATIASEPFRIARM